MRRLVAVLLGALVLVSCRTTRPVRSDAPVGRPALEDTFAPARIQFHAEASEMTARLIMLPQSGVTLNIGEEPLLTEADILTVDVAQVELGKCLLFQVNAGGARKLSQLAADGRRVVLIVDGLALGARRLEGAVTDGRVYLFAEVSEVDLPALAIKLQNAVAATVVPGKRRRADLDRASRPSSRSSVGSPRHIRADFA